MIWLLAIIVLILIVVSSGFRKFALWGVGILVLVVVIYYYDTQAKHEASHQIISHNEIRLDNVVWGQYNDLAGRVTNNSKYTLDGLTLKMTAQDCNGDNCVTIGEAEPYISATVLPGQARDFASHVFFNSPIKPTGKLQWFFVIKETTAQH